MALVLFDMDGCLLQTDSQLRLMRRLLFRERISKKRSLGIIKAGLSYSLGRSSNRQLKERTARAFEGWPRERLQALFRRLCVEELQPRFHPRLFERLEWHRAKGDQLILLSASFQGVVERVAAAASIPRAEGVPLAFDEEEHCLGSLAGTVFYGQEKLRHAVEISDELGLDLGEAWAYGDSHSDAALLGAVAHPIAVQPSRGLRALALRRGCEIIS